MKHLTLTVTIVCLLSLAYGQHKTYFGLEFSVANDIFKISDNGDYLIKVPLINGQGELNLRQEIGKNLFIETGLIMKYYQQGFGFKSIPYYSSSSGDPSWIIPVRFGLSLNVFKEKISLVPIVGYSFGINPIYSNGLGYGNQISSSATIDYDYRENSNVSRYFSLLQAGIGLEFKLFKTLLFLISTKYYGGFRETTHLDINYTVNNSNQTTGTAISKGEFWCVSTGLKYSISNFWTKKKN